ncbi:MAG: glycosyltransferase, partial [Lachnospiraceae bacterium]|nr:glycosyltransferase [Lachnospiraceae bacterium]
MRALMFASVASMVDLFNRDNIKILEELGYKVDVAANFSEGSVYSAEQAKQFKDELESKGHEVINVPVPRSMYDIKGMVNTVRILRKHMSAKRYNIVHCQSPIGGVLCRIAAAPFRKSGTKVVYYAHGFHFYKGAKMFNRIVFYNIEKICAHLTDCLITLNREDYKAASQKFAVHAEYVRGVGMNLDEINRVPAEREKVRAELNIPSDKKIILSVCELSRRKNCAVAIEAFAKADRDDSVLVLCGIGEQTDMLKELAVSLGVEKKVIFAGFCNDIIRMFKASDMFIFTSKQEGLPVALMQAMACGLPVVCSRIRG